MHCLIGSDFSAPTNQPQRMADGVLFIAYPFELKFCVCVYINTIIFALNLIQIIAYVQNTKQIAWQNILVHDNEVSIAGFIIFFTNSGKYG